MIGPQLFPGMDAPDWTPSDLDPMAVWFDARRTETMVRDTANRVSQWRDGGGLGFVLDQPNPDFQPLWSNGKMTFITAQHMQMPTPVPDGGPITIAVHLKTTSPGSWDNPISFGVGGLKLSIGDDMTWRWYSAQPITSSAFGQADLETSIILSMSPQRAFLKTDGAVLQDAPNPSDSGTLQSDGDWTIVGARKGVSHDLTAATPLEGWGGTISRICLLRQQLTFGEASLLENWLSDASIF